MRVRPHVNVLVHSFENRSAQLQAWIDLVKGDRPLKVKCAVILRHSVLAIRLLSHFDIGDRIASLLEIGDLGSGVFGRAVQHGDWNHRGQIVREAAGEEQIEAAVLVGSRSVHVRCGMPGVN